MGLIQLIVVLIVLGLVWWLISAYLPIPQPFKNIVLIVLVLIAILFLLDWVGLLHLSGPAHASLYLPDDQPTRGMAAAR